MSKYHDDRSAASDPVALRLSPAKLRFLHPSLYGLRAFLPRFNFCGKMLNGRDTRQMLAEHLAIGDSRAAMVLRTTPDVLVAAYTDEMDCAAVLLFSDAIALNYGLKPGTRLVTTNTYGRSGTLQADLWEGPASYRRFTSYFPIIADFLSDDLDVIEARKRSIGDDEWSRLTQIGREQLAKGDALRIRDGWPLLSWKTGNMLRPIV